MEDKHEQIRGGELRDHPGWWKIDGQTDREQKHWSFVRKPDGTWWYVIATDTATPIKITLGNQVTDENLLLECEHYFHELLSSGGMKKGDRVRVIQTGAMGTITDFGSVPGVPKMVNVAYDGGGGCNHMPEELQVMKDDFTPK